MLPNRPSLLVLVASAAAAAVLSLAGACTTDPAAFTNTTAPDAAPEASPGPTGTGDAAATDAGHPADPDEAPVPELDEISPNIGVLGTVGPSLVVTGNNFVPRSIVQLNGAPLATSFVSASELRATLPSQSLNAVQTLRISVGSAPPGGGASAEVAFTVEYPVGIILAMSPLSVTAGSDSLSLEIDGAEFVSGSKVQFGTTALDTAFVSSGVLKATVTSDLLGVSGSALVSVINPSPGGGASQPFSFTISNPASSITAVSPASVLVGAAPFSMTVTGTGFVNGSVVVFNGTDLATNYQSGTSLSASVPTSLLNAAGDFPISVRNPPPVAGLSSAGTFRVQYPVPSAISLSPSTLAAGSAPTEITVSGTGFFATSSQVTFDSVPAATTYVDATHLKATLNAQQLASAGSIAVQVVNSSPGGGPSTALPVVLTNAVPTISTLSPSSIVTGSPDKMITINGAGFVPQSSVTSNGAAVASTYVKGGQLTATIPANQLANPGTLSLVVTNPKPGGGMSTPASLSVGCDATGVDYSLTTLGSATTVNLTWTATNMGSRWQSAGSCASNGLETTDSEPVRYFVVQNGTGASATLSAWADCTTVSSGDAFLTFYRRPTVPANDTDRLACTFTVSEGTGGGLGYTSPDSGGSSWCPGLTKANGGGLQLGVCEKAVVSIQPYNYKSTVFTPPPRLKLRAE